MNRLTVIVAYSTRPERSALNTVYCVVDMASNARFPLAIVNPQPNAGFFVHVMGSNSRSRDTKINQRLLLVPSGVVVPSDWLKRQGISAKLADYYTRSGWLHRVGKGAFTVQPGAPDWLGAVYGVQQREENSVHPGGRTALELASLSHFLPLDDQAPLYLFCPTRERLPAWFGRLPWATRIHLVRTDFLPADIGLREHRTGSFAVTISAPERAALEFLYQQRLDAEAYSHARLVFEGLGTLRPALVQELLEQCASVKVKRLFLHLSELHGHPWLKELDLAKVSLGSGKRVLVKGGRLDPKYLITVPAEPAPVPADAP